jgi:hypothetical protein
MSASVPYGKIRSAAAAHRPRHSLGNMPYEPFTRLCRPNGAQHIIRPIDYTALGCERSRFDGIFLSLSSKFRTPEELREAEKMIRENITALAAACHGAS